jgi:hypothetical protein
VPARPRERIVLHGLEGEVLARSARGDGRHLVMRVELPAGPAVLKLFGRKRGWLREQVRDFAQRVLVGKTGMAAATRHRTERETLSLWRAAGFDVPALLEWPLPADVPPLRLLLEWLPGTTLSALVYWPHVALAEKERLLGRLARETARRHRQAMELREPRLVQSHASLAHVMVVPATTGPAKGAPADGSAAGSIAAPASTPVERLVTFDFEVAWARRSALDWLVALELGQLLDSIASFAPAGQTGGLIGAFVRAYPEPGPLCSLVAAVRRGRAPLLAPLHRLRLQLLERGPRQKLAVLAHVEAVLADDRTMPGRGQDG